LVRASAPSAASDAAIAISSHLPSPRSQIDGEEKPPRRRSTKNLRQAFRYIKLVRERGRAD
jgi:hypothetical protein